MVNFFHSSFTMTDDPINIELEIDYIPQKDFRIINIEDNIGGNPSICEILFPSFDIYQNNYRENSLVRIFLNRNLNPSPKFVGYIKDISEQEAGGGLKIIAIDLRIRLNEGWVNRNYNDRDEDGQIMRESSGVIKYWKSRDILEDIWNQYLEFAKGDIIKLKKSFSNIPNRYIGEMKLEGLSYLEAIESIISGLDLKRYFLYLEYLEDGGAILKFGDYDNGNGRADIYQGLNPDLSYKNQPFGMLNAVQIQKEEELFNKIDRIKILGSNIIIETAVELFKGWDKNLEAIILENYENYAERGSENNPNPNYILGAEFVFSRFRIPQIKDFGIQRQVPHYKNLISNNHKIYDEFGNQIQLKNFIVVQWDIGGETFYKAILKGYSIENDKYVIFNKPLFYIYSDENGEEKRIYPSKIWLNFAYISHQKFYIIYPSGISGQLKEMILNKDGADFWCEIKNWNLWQEAGMSGEETILHYYDSFRVVKNDRDILLDIAKNELAKRNIIKKNLSIKMGRMNENFRSGQKIYINQKDSGCIISSIQYDFNEMGLILMGANSND